MGMIDTKGGKGPLRSPSITDSISSLSTVPRPMGESAAFGLIPLMKVA